MLGHDIRNTLVPSSLPAAKQFNNAKIVALLSIPTGLIVAGCFVAFYLLVTLSTHNIDEVAVAGQARLAASVFDTMRKTQNDKVRDYAYWDDMFDHTVKDVEASWANENLGQYAVDTFGIGHVLILTKANATKYSYSDKAYAGETWSPASMAGLAQIADEARAAAGKDDPVAVDKVIMLDGHPHIVAAAMIRTNSDSRKSEANTTRNVLLYLQELDSTALKRIAAQFGLKNLRFVDRPLPGSHAVLPMASGAASPTAWVAWEGDKPSDNLMNIIRPGVIILFVAAMFAFAVTIQNWTRVIHRLRQAQLAAQSANIVKSEFLAMMSHEIRTPMNGVMGMAAILQESNLDQEQKRAVSIIRGSAESLLQIINDILDFSKLEASAMQIELTNFDLHDLAEYAVQIVSPRVKAKQVDLKVTIADDVPRRVRSDPGRIRQVLLNFLGNAAKFTLQGLIQLNVRVVRRTASQLTLRIEVRDTGAGIPADRLHVLFRSFQQADASISRKFGGTGLGLAISKKLVERLGGRVGVESTPDVGSNFWFEIPVEEVQSDDQAPQEKRGATDSVAPALEIIRSLGRPLRVLLAEDNATNILVAKATLSKFDIEPDVAGNGIEALEAIRTQNYDVVLMDVHMPEMDGLEATRAIRMLPDAKSEVPIIALTANAFQADIEQCRAVGMNSHLGKPFRKEELIVALAQAVRGNLEPQPYAKGANPAPLEAPVVDWSIIESFRADSGDELLGILIETFLTEAAKNLDKLSLLARDGTDKREAVRIAHSLKSSSAMAGASALSIVAARVEATLSSEPGTDVSADAGQMREVFSAYRLAVVARGLAA